MSQTSKSNSRGLIKSMLVVGSAKAVSIMISIIRMKVVAVLLGPGGIGLLSIFDNLKVVVQQMAGLGLGSSGVREIASSNGDEETLSRVRRVLLAAHLIQGAVAMIAVWLLRDRIAMWLFGDELRATQVGVIGIAVLFALLGLAQTALLQGLRRIADLSRVTVLGALVGSLVGLTSIWLLGEDGLIWFILAMPAGSVVIARFYTRRLPKPSKVGLSATEFWQTWKPMVKLGLAFMLGGLATTATLLLVRGHVSQELGLDAAGHFAAAWSITMTYVGFLLGAMAADYYPRLTEVIHDRPRATRLMNDQAQLGLAIGGPILLLLIGLAPWIIGILYSSEFMPAATLLQWQSVGNVFKLASWPLSFSIVAAAQAKTYLFMEQSFNVVFITLVFSLLPMLGLQITALAFALGYFVYLITVYILARRIHGFRWDTLSLGLLSLHASLSVALLALASTAPIAAAGASLLLAAATGLFGLRVVLIKIGPDGRMAARLSRLFASIGWPIRSKP